MNTNRLIPSLCILTTTTTVTSAALLQVGTSIPAAATVFDPAAGAFVISTGPQPFIAATFSGVLKEDVYQENLAANPLGGLTFAYYVSNDAVSLTDIERVTTFDFGGFTVDATYFVPGASQAPLNFTRSGGGIGRVIGADFGLDGAALNPGETASVLVLRTNAPSYRPGINSVIDSGTATLNGYAPIPEPAPVSLGACGAAAALLLRRRRTRKNSAAALALLVAALSTLTADRAQAFTLDNALNYVTTNDGLSTGNLNGDGNLDLAPRWDSVNRNDGKGTNRSLVGGLEYNLEGGTLATYKTEFTFVNGVTQAQFDTAFAAALNEWSSNSAVSFSKVNTNVVLDYNVAGNKLEGAEIDFFGNQTPDGILGLTSIWGVKEKVRLTNGFSPDNSGLFPSTRIYSADVILDTTRDGNPWTITAWQATLTHEIGHALGLWEAEDPHFWDTDTTINNAMNINQNGDVRTGLVDRGQKDSTDVANIVMRSEYTGLTTLSNDDIAGIRFLYPVPEPGAILGLASTAAVLLMRRRTRARRVRAN